MQQVERTRAIAGLAYLAIALAAPTALAAPRATWTGVAHYVDGAPAAGATIALADPVTGRFVQLVVADREGKYTAAVKDGDYALAVAGADGFAWLAKQHLPDNDVELWLSKSCLRLTGQIAGRGAPGLLHLEHVSHNTGEVFVTSVGKAGEVSLCLTEGQYRVRLDEGTLSKTAEISLSADSHSFRLQGFAADAIKRPIASPRRLPAELAAVADDILASKAQIIGLGEATHGTAEFVAERARLTFELLRRSDTRLLLFEFDAIMSTEIDDYINGREVDLAKAVQGLGFWITDTHELLKFLEDLRTFNRSADKPVHLWGIDLQNTTHPVEVLLGSANELSLTSAQQATIARMDKRGKAVLELSAQERRDLNALLARLAVPRADTPHDLKTALAAKSLLLQLGYWEGDMPTWYGKRRDLGMAELARFLIAGLHAHHAILWAHDGHVSKDPGDASLGAHLAASTAYYAVGFFAYRGKTRAWDWQGKIGVISHDMGTAPPFTVESVVMKATGTPEVAWLALRSLPAPLQHWLEVPRYTRMIGHTYPWNNDLLTTCGVPESFDALAVIREAHDSTPTPTGVRVADPK